MTGSQFDLLAQCVEGDVIAPGDARYDDHRRIWNAMIDRRPGAIVRCISRDDVIATVNFARERGINVAIKGGGHSAPGHSMCDEGIVIDLALMNEVSVDPVSRIARVQGGALLRDLDRETQRYGLAVPAGAVSHTGVAGLALGGGFGNIMRKHGLTIDSMMGLEVVLATGELIGVDAQNHPELFWAMRGGSGNFGVVTEFTFRAHQVGDPYVVIIIHPLDAATGVLKQWRDAVAAGIPDELNWSTYFRWAPEAQGVPDGLTNKPALMTMLQWHGDEAEGRRVVDGIARSIGGHPMHAGVMPFVALQQFADELGAHGNHAWMKAGFFDEISDDLIDALVGAADGAIGWRCAIEVLPLGGAIRRPDPATTAFAHRRSNYVFNVIGLWDEPGVTDEGIRWVRRAYAMLEPFMTGGVYVNYMGGDETGGIAAAYGGTDLLRRLRKIKTVYDPGNLFCYNFNIAPLTGADASV